MVVAEDHQLTGHRSSVLCMRVHGTRFLVSGSSDGTLKVPIQPMMLPSLKSALPDLTLISSLSMR